ncbi:ferritin-like domain-containing protein [Pseudonocardia sp. CA-142604]|uniref:ferritin-like domain-containing protein n=1 Tax=Pseudonocardia sp. CA-142604 TaxID=3240024 RepID=UPI003D912B16
MTLSTTGIATLDDLRTHLQWAIELEHSTLPPYFCALSSLDPTRNAEATQVLSSVFVGGGRVDVVQDLASALDALGEIVEQGEGTARTDV